ncbi:metallopeptidase [Thermocladium modestius]|uniref:Metallopeptidase n=1 Tax=Thermocladium modestius TaxID=62609 RepID=A0A830GVB4_9CREN|nr:putative metallopeptidase [Thermocladium modestius]GGP20820.1 metallopeptidase [Thermocladium modestius]
MLRFEAALDVAAVAVKLNEEFGLGLDLGRVAFIRSRGSRSRAVARTLGTPSQWRFVLNPGVLYVVEVIAERFDHLDCAGRAWVVLHELLHIPPSMSGGLRNHSSPAFKAMNRMRRRVEAMCRDGRV